MTIALWSARDYLSTTNSTMMVMVNNSIDWILVQSPNPLNSDHGESHQDAMPPQQWWDEDFGGL
jgi:hypothetical protein